SISGIVASGTGEPLAGANVVVEGTELGSAANADGAYSIKVDEGSYQWSCSRAGYLCDFCG
ncbi:MAG: hypothetical protein HN757_02440, partial [Calditrichaeota bacterium]|nr:hypothetical protein [Calditrichota bacterium]